MEKLSQTRRKFITTLMLLVSGTALFRYLIPRHSAKRRLLVTANVADLPHGGALLFRDERLALLQDENGYYALSLICTHLGCTVAVTENMFACPCHGSHFDRQGVVLKGPAGRLLERFMVVRNGERLEVFDEIVSAPHLLPRS